MPQKWLSVRQSDYERCKTTSGSSPWVKLHRELLNDPAFISLTPASRFLYIGLIFLATESGNKVYGDRTWIGQRLYIGRTNGGQKADTWRTEVDLTPLYRSGLLEGSNVRRLLREDRDREEKEIEKETPALPAAPRGFDLFWEQYPKKKSKGQAERAWKAIKPDQQLQDRILHALEQAKTSDQWQKERGEFIPYPATWLNAKGWEDEHKVTVLPIRPALPRVTPALPKGEDCPPEAAALLAKLGGIGKVF